MIRYACTTNIWGVGNAINAATAAAVTEAAGWLIAAEFDKQSRLAQIVQGVCDARNA